MDIEKLTKAQLILLALLVSFVTSIATGIVTVTLLDQAPPAVTNTINRVVERTVESVSPRSQGASVVTKETTTVVVKEEDLITESIDTNAERLARVYRSSDNSTFLGMGFFVSDKGLVATDASTITPGEEYVIETKEGTEYRMNVIREVGSIAFIAPKEGEVNDAVFTSVSVADPTSLKLGQTALSLSGRERTNVSIGIISALITEDVTIKDEDGNDVTKTVLTQIGTTVDTSAVIFGSPLLNIFGEVIGIHVQGSRNYVPIRPDQIPN